ncbi:MAG: GH36-type glycosyl hydrolase domain-containing protein, partial [Gemmatimonadota bacterium]
LFYIARTEDRAILDEEARFLSAPLLPEGEDEIFVRPVTAAETGTLYEHCCRAIDRSLTTGEHGLPLMGAGDWNDGMNRVGREGRGESVWLGFFLFDILEDFIPICEARGDVERARNYEAHMTALRDALNDGGWDGAWYRRAYYDDGTPLGSAANDECRIDALAQAWSVISGAAPPERATQAIAAMQEQLVSERAGIIRLLTPPFDQTRHDPGYIKGYVPGVRENGGQYTHAAMWAVRALAELGLRERAAPLLEMLSPVTRAGDPHIYQGEPYVIAADVYGEDPHVGRAGWTWYTGSAGWMYRVFLESLLGFDLRGDVVHLRPCLPAAWPGFTLRHRLPDGTVYTFEVEQTTEETGPVSIPIVRDGGEHVVRVQVGPDVVPRYSASTAPLLRTTSE